MDEKLQKQMRLFARISFWEAISFVLLLIAMPLKYVYDWPYGVKFMGSIHGILFLGYVFQLAYLAGSKIWPFGKLLKYFLASFIPLAPFWVEKEVKAELGSY